MNGIRRFGENRGSPCLWQIQAFMKHRCGFSFHQRTVDTELWLEKLSHGTPRCHATFSHETDHVCLELHAGRNL